jgi:hypothetical protein
MKVCEFNMERVVIRLVMDGLLRWRAAMNEWTG